MVIWTVREVGGRPVEEDEVGVGEQFLGGEEAIRGSDVDRGTYLPKVSTRRSKHGRMTETVPPQASLFFTQFGSVRERGMYEPQSRPPHLQPV